MQEIRIAVVGVGNCASALVQGLAFHRAHPDFQTGLMHPQLGGYLPGEITVAAAFDIDARKVGRPLSEAVFAAPNCAQVFCRDLPEACCSVRMGRVLDGVAAHMHDHELSKRIALSPETEAGQEEVIRALCDARCEILVNYLPVGSQRATEFYLECALEAGVGVVNCIPVFAASSPKWAAEFHKRGLPLVGDDVKSQLGATIVHRSLMELCRMRGIAVEGSYQLNVGGNTDFENMLDRSRLHSKRISKTEAVQSVLETPLPPDSLRIGPSDYVPWLNDTKVCFMRIQGKGFGGCAMNLELRLSVEDSPNSAGVVIDAVRACKIARSRGIGGVLVSASAFLMKHPPEQHPDHEALQLMDDFVANRRRN